MRSRWRLALGAFLLTTGMASAQETGEITGRVTDASGGVLPGVVVTATSPVLLEPLVATTGPTGTYRFPRVPIGTYRVAFELAGFSRVVREDVKIEMGFGALVDAQLDVAGLEQTVTVTGTPPIVDARDSTKGGLFAREDLDRIPTARDPWAVVARTPGVVMAGVNVGGNLSGMQGLFIARTPATWMNRYTLDGVDITDLVFGAGSSIYYDFDSFQEVRVTTGGGETSQMGGGVGVNMVTRSGTDTFRGTARVYLTDDSLEADNVTQELRAQGAGAGNPIKRITDFGLEAGGPIAPRRAWIWGAYGRQDIEVGVANFYRKTDACAELTGTTAIDYPMQTVRDCMQPDLTTIWTASLKAQARLFAGNKLSWFSNFFEKVKPTRDASDRKPLETTFRQHAMPRAFGAYLWTTGPGSIWKAGDQHIISDRWLVEAQWAHQGNNYALDFHDDALAGVQPAFEMSTQAWSRSYFASYYLRPVNTVRVSTEYFAPSLLGGDHAIQASWQWRAGSAWTERRWGGSTVARFQNGVASQADLYRAVATEYGYRSHAVWLQDTYTRERLTLMFGLRWDQQRDWAMPSSAPAHPFQGQTTAQGATFAWLPAVDFAGADPGPTLSDVSPHIGITYNVGGNGRTVLKGSYARYHAPSGAGWSSSVVNPVTDAMIRFPWSDTNRDGFVQAGELDTTRILAFSGNYNPYNPSALASPNSIDPAVTNPAIDEVIVGVDREVGAEFAVGASYIWRRDTRQLSIAPIGLTSADYVQRAYTPPASDCPVAGARCPTVTYWEPTIKTTALVATNRPDYYRSYHGFELTARRRMRDGWMLDGSIAIHRPREHFPSAASYTDPTNLDMVGGAVTAMEPGFFAVLNVGVPPSSPPPLTPPTALNATWVAKLSGAYQLPWWTMSLAGSYRARQGDPYLPSIQIASRANLAGAVLVLLDRVGSVRLPDQHMLDLGIARPFRVGPVTLTANLDVFNVLNANTALARERVQNSPEANQVKTIVAPRVIRLGLRASW